MNYNFGHLTNKSSTLCTFELIVWLVMSGKVSVGFTPHMETNLSLATCVSKSLLRNLNPETSLLNLAFLKHEWSQRGRSLCILLQNKQLNKT